MIEHEEFALLDEYVLGTLGPADAERVGEHLALCAPCRAEYNALRDVFDVLPQALPAAPPPAATRDRLLARIEPHKARAPRRRWPPRSSLTAALAAALVLALAGNVYLAKLLATHHDAPVQPRVTPAPIAAVPSPRPAPAHSPSDTILAVDRGLRQRIAGLERELRDERSSEGVRATRDAAAIAALRKETGRQSALLAAAQRQTPRPSTPQPGATALVAALSSGRVYGVDGSVGGEAWHLTILQPPAGANAVIFTQVPHAPPGETYRTWVLRAGRIFDAGELRAGTQTRLEMPMPLADGDVVAFSREAVGSGDQPTTPFLMEVKIQA